MLKPNVKLEGKTIFVTGAAGFIGFFLSRRLLDEVEGVTVVGIDNMNDYYEVSLKEYRLNQLLQYPNGVPAESASAVPQLRLPADQHRGQGGSERGLCEI